MSFHQNKPDEIFKEELNDLHSAVKDAGHDYHLFTIATVNDKTPEIRTVVLRDFNIKKYQISFHTDARSPKYSQVKSNPAISNVRLTLPGTVFIVNIITEAPSINSSLF